MPGTGMEYSTLRYIQLTDKMKKATEAVFVPEFLKTRKAN